MERREHADAVRDSFSRQVDAFSGEDSAFARREGPVPWLGPLDPSMIVLDVACGAAHAVEVIAPFVRQVVGFDLTVELLALGARRLRDHGIANVLLQEGEAEALPFVDQSFDLAYCESALHHMADPQAAVEQMVRVCRPGARVAVLDLIAPPGVDRDRFDELHRLLDPSHVRTFLADELADLFPTGTSVSPAETSALRLPIDVAVSEQSAREPVLAALRAELDGGVPTGFDPTEQDGSVIVSFMTAWVCGQVELAANQ